MSQLHFPDRRGRERPVRAVVALLAGVILIIAGIALALQPQAHTQSAVPVHTPMPASPTPSVAEKSPTPANQVARGQDELGLSLEEFQAKYESLSGKGDEQETFFKNAVGKKIAWTVQVDQVFRAKTGVIVVFLSPEQPDWAAFPISDAHFPSRLENELMKLSRGDIIRIEGRIIYQGIKTLECSSFEIVRSEARSD